MSRTITGTPGSPFARAPVMTVVVTNAQREAPVNASRMRRLAQCATRRLRMTGPGQLAIIFVGSRRIQALNRRFLGHDRATDVLSFRYDEEPVVGEIVISPRAAQRYAAQHGLPYEQELARYVVHGLLHWLGHEDRTAAQQRKMRVMEDRLLDQCTERTKHQIPSTK